MNKLIVLLAIVSACGAEPSALPPDAAQLPADATMPADAARPRDAAIDTPAPEPEFRGCMGNLPTSRTVTVNTGDPVSPNLLNELQDQFPSGGRRSQWSRMFRPRLLKNSIFSDQDTTSFAPVFQKSSGTGIVYMDVPYEAGDTFNSLEIEMCGDASVDVTIELDYSSTGTASSFAAYSSLGTLIQNNVPATFSYYLIANTHQLLASGAVLIARLSVSAANLQIGMARATFTR